MANMAILTTNQPTSEGGAGCQTNCAWSGSEEKLFLLTSPFIELSGGPDFWLPEKSGKFHNLGLTLRPSGDIRIGTVGRLARLEFALKLRDVKRSNRDDLGPVKAAVGDSRLCPRFRSASLRPGG